MTKIQVGDKIHIEASVVSIYENGIINIEYSSTTGGKLDNTCVHASLHGKNPAIVLHIPKPPEPLRVRDQVQYKSRLSYQTEPGPGTILAFFEDRAWVAFGNLSVPLSPLIDSLERIK